MTASISDSNRNIIESTDITANLLDLGFGVEVSSDSYDPSTGVATWTLNGTSVSADTTLVVTVGMRDDAGNKTSA